MSQKAKTCQESFLELLHGKVDATTLAEFHQLQVQMDSSGDHVGIKLDATSHVGLKKVFNEASKTGTIKDIDALCHVTYNFLGEDSNGTCPLFNAASTKCTNDLLFSILLCLSLLPPQWPTLVTKDKCKQTLKN